MARCFTTNMMRSMLQRGPVQSMSPPPHPGMLDPEGIHVIGQHVQIGSEVRCFVLFKPLDSDEAISAPFNMNVEDFEACPTVEDVLANIGMDEQENVL